MGTGFVVASEGNGASEKGLYFLVTNKHMIGDWTLADGDILEFRNTLEVSFYGGVGRSFTPITVPLLDAENHLLSKRLRLADNPNVDVAVVFLNEIMTATGTLKMTGFGTSYLLPFNRMSSYLTGLGDQIFALGYPLGITSARTSHPIAKAGYLATVPGEEFAIDIPSLSRNATHSTTRLEGKLLVVDGLIVAGNSGGPIVLPSELKMRRDPATKEVQLATEQTKNLVIGIVSMGIGDSGLTLAYASDYIVDVITRFVADLANPRSKG
jgi:hypothetical protein